MLITNCELRLALWTLLLLLLLLRTSLVRNFNRVWTVVRTILGERNAVDNSSQKFDVDGASAFARFVNSRQSADVSQYAQHQTVENFEALSCPKFEVYQDKAGEYRFRLKASNGQIGATGEGYKALAGCLSGIESVKCNAPEAELVREEVEVVKPGAAKKPAAKGPMKPEVK